MKRRYKLILIILIGIILAIVINVITIENKISIVALGDGVALGMTAYNMVGYSYNDYLKEYYENRNTLKDYNNEFSIQHLTIEELDDYLEKNIKGSKTKIPFKQSLAKADIITLNVGMDEFIDYSIKNMLDDKRIDKFIDSYDKFLKTIRTFYDNKIIVIGLYPVYNLEKSTIFDINNRINNIAGKYNAMFLDITAISLNEDYYANNSSYYMNYRGHKAIYKLIYKMI